MRYLGGMHNFIIALGEMSNGSCESRYIDGFVLYRISRRCRIIHDSRIYIRITSSFGRHRIHNYMRIY